MTYRKNQKNLDRAQRAGLALEHYKYTLMHESGELTATDLVDLKWGGLA
jgi:hypothetical protein